MQTMNDVHVPNDGGDDDDFDCFSSSATEKGKSFLEECRKPCEFYGRGPTMLKGSIILPPTTTDDYTLVLDLEETVTCGRNEGHETRPYLDEFLASATKNCEIVVWTSSTKENATAVVREVDKRDVISYCIHDAWFKGQDAKDLTLLGRSMSKVLLVDDAAENLRENPFNGVIVQPFTEGDDAHSDDTLRRVGTLVQQLAESGRSVPDFLQSSPLVEPRVHADLDGKTFFHLKSKADFPLQPAERPMTPQTPPETKFLTAAKPKKRVSLAAMDTDMSDFFSKRDQRRAESSGAAHQRPPSENAGSDGDADDVSFSPANQRRGISFVNECSSPDAYPRGATVVMESILIPPADVAYTNAYTLVLELDETLIYAKDGPLMVRPKLNEFLACLDGFCEIVVWTVREREYARAVVANIDLWNTIFYCVYKHERWFKGDSCCKDPVLLGRPLSKVLIVDVLPQNLRQNPTNALIVPRFTGADDENDDILLRLASFVKQLVYSGLPVPEFLQQSTDLTEPREHPDLDGTTFYHIKEHGDYPSHNASPPENAPVLPKV